MKSHLRRKRFLKKEVKKYEVAIKDLESLRNSVHLTRSALSEVKYEGRTINEVERDQLTQLKKDIVQWKKHHEKIMGRLLAEIKYLERFCESEETIEGDYYGYFVRKRDK